GGPDDGGRPARVVEARRHPVGWNREMKRLAQLRILLRAHRTNRLRAEARIASGGHNAHAAWIVEWRNVKRLGAPVAVRAVAVAEVRGEARVADVEVRVLHADAEMRLPRSEEH